MITYMESGSQDPIAIIESALMTMRRDQQARRLQRGRGPRGHGPAAASARGAERGAVPGADREHGHDRSLGGAARFRMLDSLEAGSRTVSEIAGSVGVDQPRASRLVAEAADRGLVRRSVDPRDARRAVVELTPAGLSFLKSAHRSRRSAVETALQGFSDPERAQFAALLDRFVAAWPRHDLDPE
jgi:DNA-binding MarR family transcriptional regulator